MNIASYFRFSSYLMFATSFLMLLATGQLEAVSIGLYALVLLGGWLIDAERVRWQIPRWLANGVMIFYLPFTLVDWRILGSPPVIVAIHFIFFASSLKLLHPKQNRDWLWLYVVAFFEMLLAAGMMIDTTFFLLLLVFLFAAISTLTSFEIRRAQHEAQSDVEIWKETSEQKIRLAQPRWRQLGYFSALSLVIILLLAAPLFLAMPRLSTGMFGGGLAGGATLTGFSDNVRLGEVAQIKLNPQRVMRVIVKQPPQQYRMPLRWRGVTLDTYDGESWKDSQHHQRQPLRVTDKGFLVADDVSLEDIRENPFITEQTFYLSPLGIGTIFAAPRPLLVRPDKLTRLARDSSDGLWTTPYRTNHLSYTVFSDTRQYGEKELQADSATAYPQEIIARYTQLPENFDNRIGQLAQQISRDAQNRHDIARRVESWLRTSLRYSLDLKRTNNDDPLADFLFNVKAGHCEYFATAMAMLLRTRGIPTRLVNGFQTGEYVEVADAYIVRQSDAHSWVEVYYPNHGWVTFDPTPAAGLSRYEAGMLSTLRHYAEAAELFWMQKVIGFDAQEQLSIAMKVQGWMSSWQNSASSRWLDWRERFAEWIKAWRAGQAAKRGFSPDEDSPTEWLRDVALHPGALAFYCLIGLIGGTLYWRKHARSWQRQVRHDAAASAVAFYQEMLIALERLGHKREPSQTPQEFAATLPLPEVTEITRVYHQVRFGGAQMTAAEIDQISHLLRAIKKLKK